MSYVTSKLDVSSHAFRAGVQILSNQFARIGRLPLNLIACTRPIFTFVRFLLMQLAAGVINVNRWLLLKKVLIYSYKEYYPWYRY